MSDVTPEVIAEWMIERLEQRKLLYQADAVREIAKNFGYRGQCRMTVRLPFSSIRCSACQVTARARTWASTSRPASASVCGE
jgi:hypothetical protein